MALVPAKCTQCGARLDVDSLKETAICPYCQTAFVVEKATTNHYDGTNIINVDRLSAENITVLDSNSADNLFLSGKTFIKIGDFDSAKNKFDEMTNRFPYDARGWYGIIQALSKNFKTGRFTIDYYTTIIQNFEKYAVVATEQPEEKKRKQEIIDYVTILQKRMSETHMAFLKEQAAKKEEKKKHISELQQSMGVMAQEGEAQKVAVLENSKQEAQQIKKKKVPWLVFIILSVLLFVGCNCLQFVDPLGIKNPVLMFLVSLLKDFRVIILAVCLVFIWAIAFAMKREAKTNYEVAQTTVHNKSASSLGGIIFDCNNKMSSIKADIEKTDLEIAQIEKDIQKESDALTKCNARLQAILKK